MAVTLVSEPNTMSALFSCINFVFNIDDVGTGQLENKIGYQIFAEDGVTPLSPLNIYKRKSPGNVTVDIAPDLYGQIFTSIPQISGGNNINYVLDDTNFTIKVQVKFGEIIYNNTTGVVTNNVNTFTSIIIIANSALQRAEAFVSGSSMYIFSHRPQVLHLRQMTHEYLWIGSSVSFSIGFTYHVFTGGATEIGSITKSISGGTSRVAVISLRPTDADIAGLGVSWRQITRIDVSFAHSFSDITTYYSVCGDYKYQDIMFLDPKGSRGTLSFDAPLNRTVSSSFTEITRRDCIFASFNNGSPDFAGSESVSGDIVLNKTSYQNFQFTTEAAYTEELAEYYKLFLASPTHHIVERDSSGDPINILKFNLAGGSIKYFDEDNIVQMQISGKIAHAINVHPIDR